MPKTRRPRKKKKSEEWKKLLRAHKKGPKRIKLPKERFKKGIDPLTVREHTKHVQIIVDQNYYTYNICVVVLNSAFSQMSIGSKTLYEMTHGTLNFAGRCLIKALTTLGHNDRVLKKIKEVKSNGIAGRFLVADGKFKAPDVTLRIREDVQQKPKVISLPKRPSKSPKTTNIEYM